MSSDDVTVTVDLVRSGNPLKIELVDHIVVGERTFATMKERCLGFA